MQSQFEIKKMHQVVLSLLSILAMTSPVFAADPIDLGVVDSSGVSSNSEVSTKKLQDLSNTDKNPNSAIYQAPTQASLIATQPQSIINQHYIEENASPAANYTDIAAIAPSIVSIDPNGPGLMENQSLTIRGFQDGQYNVTFDGIPWGDSNDFTHHSTSYFMPQDLGKITIDRGPGDASNIGDATFGGTIAVLSKEPTSDKNVKIDTAYGSWNTRLLGGEYNTGVLENYGDMRAYMSYKDLYSDGYLTGGKIHRENAFFKIEKPVGDDTLLTAAVMYNNLHQNVLGGGGYGNTLQQIQQYGKNYSMSSNPNSQNYTGYNYDEIHTDFEYIGLNTHFGDLNVDNKTYTYAYYHNGYNTSNAADGTSTVNGNGSGNFGTVVNGQAYPNDIPGQKMYNNYRSYGDTLRLSEAVGSGEINAGIWIDYQTNERGQYEIDWSQNQALNTVGGNPIDRQMNDSLTTIQPYLQYVWKPTESWNISPGLKYAYFKREVNAAVNQGTQAPFNGSQDWEKALPALTARYAINSNWSAYGQFAEGFLAPNLNVFYKPGTQPGTLSPEQTKNYQVGTTWANQDFTLGFDVYKVDFTNFIKSTYDGQYTTFSNVGGVKYSGAELEGTYHIGHGFSLYGNYGYNHYTTNDGSVLQNTPQNTEALGVIFEQGAVYSSLITKEVGARYSGVDANGNNIHFGSYAVTNFTLNYNLQQTSLYKDAKLGLQVNNLFNNQDLYASFANTADGTPTFYSIPERNVMATLTIGL